MTTAKNNPNSEAITGPSDTSDRDIIITRVFNAPRALVWTMFTEPKHLMKWWGPREFTTPACEIDLRPGGVWFYVLRAPDGSEFPVHHTYQEIVPLERIVYSQGHEDATSSSGTMHTMNFEDEEGKTRVTLHTRTPSPAVREALVNQGFVQGVSGGMDCLVEYLETL